jgi:uncharacterized protein
MRETTLGKAVVDTNVLVAIMIDDDRNHREAIRLWESIEKAVVPTIVLFELSFFLVKHDLSFEILEKVVTDPKIEVIPSNLDDLLYLSRHSKSVRYYDDVSDIMIMSASRRLGIDLKSFDRDLLKMRTQTRQEETGSEK